jgi:enamine deaminase RidA (YjgF/YER057c/UK114 family)
VKAGDRLWISGTVGMTADGTIPDSVEEQFQIAINHLDGVLRAAGGGPQHIVKVQLFLTDINDRAKINPIRQAYFGEHRPASTLVEVSALVLPQLKVEIEAEAVLDSSGL